MLQKLHITSPMTVIAIAIVLAVGIVAGAAALFTGHTSTNAAERTIASGKVGQTMPDVAERDVTSGRTITLRSFGGKNVLFYFSAGATCQSCMYQIPAIEKLSAQLDRKHIQLVSVTTDDAPLLREIGRQLHITTPMISDPERVLSSNYDVLGRGMHGMNVPNHSFVLVSPRGKVLWRRDYEPMWADPQSLVSQLP